MTDDDVECDEGGGEPVVRCPVEDCTAEHVSRGLHLHILRSVGSGHGEQGDVPPGVDLDDAVVVGRQHVDVDYPAERKSEAAARLCPYCERPFKGKNGVLIHLGLVEGRRDHPTNASEVHDSTDFPVVEVDENENVVAVVDNSGVSAEDQFRECSDEGAERDTIVELTREEVEYLYGVFREEEIEDDRVGRILQRGYLAD